MPWLNLDDGYADHPKHAPLSDGAFRLLTAALCYCARHTSDGVVSAAAMRTLHPRFRQSYLDELMASHPDRPDVVETPDGYWVRDYLQWNRSAAQIDAERARKSKGGRRGAESRWHKP